LALLYRGLVLVANRAARLGIDVEAAARQIGEIPTVDNIPVAIVRAIVLDVLVLIRLGSLLTKRGNARSAASLALRLRTAL